jgi:hypothetical protein
MTVLYNLILGALGNNFQLFSCAFSKPAALKLQMFLQPKNYVCNKEHENFEWTNKW